jgi:hypothetical protein
LRRLVAQSHAAVRDVQMMVGAGTAVGQLMRRHPGLMTELSLDDWPVLLRPVLSGGLDIAIAGMSAAADEPSLVVENSLPTRLMALMKAPASAVRLELFAPEANREMLVEALHLAPLIAIESDAVGVALASMIAQDVASELRSWVDLKLTWMTTNYGIIQLAGRPPPPAALVLLDILRKVDARISAAELRR